MLYSRIIIRITIIICIVIITPITYSLRISFLLLDSLFLSFESLLSNWLLAQRTIVIVLQPLFNALRVEVVLFITRQGNNIVFTREVKQAYWTRLKCYIILWVKLLLSQFLEKVRRGRHPIRSLGSSNSEKHYRQHDTDTGTETAALQHLKVAYHQD